MTILLKTLALCSIMVLSLGSAAEQKTAPKPTPVAVTSHPASSSIDHLNAPCPEQIIERRSQLCAQWVSADAANRGAMWSMWSAVGTLASTLLLVWTLRETRQATIRQQRAYVAIEAVGDGVVQAGKPIVIPINVKNYGATPANDVAIASAVVVRDVTWKWTDEPTTDEPMPHTDLVIHPNVPVHSEMRLNEAVPAQVHKAVMEGKAAVFAKATVYYRDVFKRRRISEFRMEFHGLDAGPNGTGGRIRLSPGGNRFI